MTATHRIAFVSRSYYPDDPRLARQAAVLREEGCDVHVVCLRRPGTNEPASDSIDGVTVTRLGGTRHRAGKARYVAEYGSFFAGAAAELVREHSRRRFALVQVANPPDALLGCALPVRLRGARLVLDIHDLSPELYASKFGRDRRWPFGAHVMRVLERGATAAADHVLVAGELFREALIGRGLSPDRVTSIPNGPDERLFPAGRRTGRDPEQIVYHGSLFDRYGFSLALDALPAIHAACPGVRVDVWGDGPELEPLRARAAREFGGGAVVFHGPAPLDEIPARVGSGACGLSTLRSDCFTELAFPTKVAEYAQLGVPVAASRTRALTEVFPDDALAYYEPGDAGGLARAVVSLLADPQAAERQAERAGEAVTALLWSLHAPRYARVILTLARDRRRARSSK
jgi:glycosyltransferase involved in cell wall biosynthesis